MSAATETNDRTRARLSGDAAGNVNAVISLYIWETLDRIADALEAQVEQTQAAQEHLDFLAEREDRRNGLG